MNPFDVPEEHELLFHPELAALAALTFALELARRALSVNYPSDPDPPCPRIPAADAVLDHISSLDNAVAQYRELVLAHDDLRLF